MEFWLVFGYGVLPRAICDSVLLETCLRMFSTLTLVLTGDALEELKEAYDNWLALPETNFCMTLFTRLSSFPVIVFLVIPDF